MANLRKNLTRYKKVLILRDRDKKTFSEIAEIFGVSRQRIWQIYCRASLQQKSRQKISPLPFKEADISDHGMTPVSSN